MRIAPNAKCQRVLVLALWLVDCCVNVSGISVVSRFLRHRHAQCTDVRTAGAGESSKSGVFLYITRVIKSLLPRLHDTTGCQTGCSTGCTTGLTTGCIHDTTGCQCGLTTGLTTGCIV